LNGKASDNDVLLKGIGLAVPFATFARFNSQDLDSLGRSYHIISDQVPKNQDGTQTKENSDKKKYLFPLKKKQCVVFHLRMGRGEPGEQNLHSGFMGSTHHLSWSHLIVLHGHGAADLARIT
jgi:hypothetical protein